MVSNIHYITKFGIFGLYLSLTNIAETTGLGLGSLYLFNILSLAKRSVDPPPSKFKASRHFKSCINIPNSVVVTPADPEYLPSIAKNINLLN
jgi:hypothetical protein